MRRVSRIVWALLAIAVLIAIWLAASAYRERSRLVFARGAAVDFCDRFGLWPRSMAAEIRVGHGHEGGAGWYAETPIVGKEAYGLRLTPDGEVHQLYVNRISNETLWNVRDSPFQSETRNERLARFASSMKSYGAFDGPLVPGWGPSSVVGKHPQAVKRQLLPGDEYFAFVSLDHSCSYCFRVEPDTGKLIEFYLNRPSQP